MFSSREVKEVVGPTRSDQRRNTFKHGVDKKEARRIRESHTESIRKKKKDEQMMAKRRRQSTATNQIGMPPLVNARSKDNQTLLPYIRKYVSQFESQNHNERLTAVSCVRKLLSRNTDPPTQEVIQCGGIKPLIKCLDPRGPTDLQFEASWALANIASGTTEQTLLVANSGAIPCFIQLLDSPNAEVRDQAVWALGNFTGESEQMRDFIFQKGGVMKLCRLVPKDLNLMERRHLVQIVWCLSNLCRGTKPFINPQFVAPMYPYLVHIMKQTQDEEVLRDMIWAWNYISEDITSLHKAEAIIKSPVCGLLISYLGKQYSTKIQVPTLRTLGNLIVGSDEQTQAVLDQGLLRALQPLIRHESVLTRKEVFWILSNIAGGTSAQIRLLLRANFIDKFIHAIETDKDIVKREATWALCNCIHGGTDAQRREILRTKSSKNYQNRSEPLGDCINALCIMLEALDVKILLNVLKTLDFIMLYGDEEAKTNGSFINVYVDQVEMCGGLDKLESLQSHVNETIYLRVMKILTCHFERDDQGEHVSTTPAPKVKADTFQFNPTLPMSTPSVPNQFRF